MKEFEVLNSGNGKWFSVDEDWLEGVENIDSIDELVFSKLPTTEELEVTYKSGNRVYYQNVYGTWGQPYTIK
jgi:hypothetical protein